MKFSLGTKITLAFVAFAIVLSGITLAIGYRVVDDMNSHHYTRKADEVAATVARVVNSDSAAKLKADVLDIYKEIDSKDRVSSDDWGSPAFEAYSQRFAHLQDTPEYQELLAELRKLQEVNDVSCFYLWFVDPHDEVCIYLVDAALEDPCPTGCIDPLYDFNRAILSDPSRGFPAYITDTEEYGWLVTAGAPVNNEAGDVVAEAVTLNYGNFIQVTIDFLIVALCIFAVIKLINKATSLVKKPEEEAPAAAPEPSAEEKLLTEIRDLLKTK